MLATGWAEGGRAGAQAALRAFWLDISTQHTRVGAGSGAGSGACFGGCFGAWPGLPSSPPGLASFNLNLNPFYAWTQQLTRLFSPYQFNPLGGNPLRDVLLRHVKPQVLTHGPLPLFITATSVHTGQPRVFDQSDLSIDALLASACLPQMFRAVEIDGEPYWDGGYSGNPAIWPLVYNTDALDVLLVKINPLVRAGIPDTPEEIADRINEITFNAGLVSEMRAIAFVQKLIDEGHLTARSYKNLRLHMVADDEGLAPLHASSKVNTDRNFLEALHALGRAAADRWLLAHRADVGVRGTLDLQRTFLTPRTPPRTPSGTPPLGKPGT